MAVERSRSDGWSPASAAVAGADDEDALIGRNVAERQHQLAFGQFRGPAHAVSANERRGVEPGRFLEAAPAIGREMHIGIASATRPRCQRLGVPGKSGAAVELGRACQRAAPGRGQRQSLGRCAPTRHIERIPAKAPLVEKDATVGQRREPGALDAVPIIARRDLRRAPGLAPVG